MSGNISIDNCAGIVLDIAGTVTPLKFIEETLLPFAVKNAEEFLKSNWEKEEIQSIAKELLPDESELDAAKIFEHFKKLTEEKSEEKPIKSLQGLIYKNGYDNGDLKAEIFEDVKNFISTYSQTKKMAIYSTGSIDSQKMLFANTTQGDLSDFIHNYFDQSLGLKTDSASYEKIAKELSLSPEEMVFISDSVAENEAAKAAGFTAVLVKREGNPEVSEDDAAKFKTITAFSELQFSNKRKVDETDGAVAEVPPSKVAKTEEETTAETKPEDKVTEKTEEAKTESMEVDSTESVEEKKTEVEVTKSEEVSKTEEKVELKETEEKKEEVVEEKKEESGEKVAEEKTETDAKSEEVKQNGHEEKKDNTEKTVEENVEKKETETIEQAKEEVKEDTKAEVKEENGSDTKEKVQEKEEVEKITEKTENGVEKEIVEEEKENMSETANSKECIVEATPEEIKAKKVEEEKSSDVTETTPVTVEA